MLEHLLLYGFWIFGLGLGHRCLKPKPQNKVTGPQIAGLRFEHGADSDPVLDNRAGAFSLSNIGALIITNTIFGGFLIILEYHGPQNPILIIKAPIFGWCGFLSGPFTHKTCAVHLQPPWIECGRTLHGNSTSALNRESIIMMAAWVVFSVPCTVYLKIPTPKSSTTASKRWAFFIRVCIGSVGNKGFPQTIPLALISLT